MADELYQPRSEDGPDWAAYYRHTQGRQPRPLFLKAMAAVAVSGAPPGHAVEIGFGDGTETLALLAEGWHVTAIDPTPEAAGALRAAVPEDAADRLTIVTARAQDAELPHFDLLYAGYALSFIRPAAFPRFWEHVRERLRPGGILVANVFGTRDTWAGDPEMTFVDRAGAGRLVEGLEVIAIDEEDADGNSFDGPKHWHVFDLVARRPPPEVA
ncbi:MAG: class I SAM-dependent methyltransferase [Chloroflexi bacterium]|nr:class I SAM-dependent methyltransferase [Chloroflexota bacterium]